VDETNLEFCSIHVPYIILPCGYMDILSTYKIGKNRSRINKMIVLGIEQIIAYSSLFTYYEQDMAKSMLLFDYYKKIIRDGMNIGRLCLSLKGKKMVEKIITINEGKERSEITK
jgi:hypothetical protein